MVLREEKSIIFSYQYELSIILEECNYNGICLLCGIIIRDYKDWYTISIKLATRLAVSIAIDVATRLTNGIANNRANNRIAGLAISRAND